MRVFKVPTHWYILVSGVQPGFYQWELYYPLLFTNGFKLRMRRSCTRRSSAPVYSLYKNKKLDREQIRW